MKRLLLVSLSALTSILWSCSAQRAPEPAVVRVFRDPTAAEVQSALLTLGARRLKTSLGRPIIIATYEPESYARGLETLGRREHPDLIVFNSPEDARRTNTGVPPHSAVEVGGKGFCLVIPPWVSGEQREIAELVLGELRRELQTPGATAPGNAH